MSLIRVLFWFAAITVTLRVTAQAPRIVINPQGHAAKIHGLVFTPDASRLISVSEDKTVRVWNSHSGALEKKFETEIGDGYEGMLYASALSPDGRFLAIGGYQVATEQENYIAIIDLEREVQVATAKGHTDVINSLSFCPTGEYLASGSADGTVKIWDVHDLPNLVPATTLTVGSSVSSLSFGVSLQLAVASESKDVQVYNMKGLKQGQKQFSALPFKGHKGSVSNVSYSRDGVYLASTCNNNEFYLWTYKGKPILHLDKLKHPVTALAFSFDGKIIALLDEAGEGSTYTIPGGLKLAEFHGHDNTVLGAAFSPSLTGNYLVASAGGNNNEICLWNPITGNSILRIKGHGSLIQDLSFAEGYRLYISRGTSGGSKSVKHASFDFSSFTVSAAEKPVAAAVKSGAFNKVVLTGPNSIGLPNGKLIQTDPSSDGRILAFKALPDGSIIVASDFSLRMFDKNGYFSKEFAGHQGAIRTISVSADGKYLASGGEDQTIILWRLDETGSAPSMRSVFQGAEWDAYFSSLPIDSLTRENTKKAWEKVIAFLRDHREKVYKQIEATYRSFGEVMLPYATLFLADDNEWVCWTPGGYFSCSSSGARYFGWHVNKGVDNLADYYDADQFFEILYRPNELAKSIVEGKRVETILRASGERIFDLTRLHRPSAVMFDHHFTDDTTSVVFLRQGKFITRANSIPLNVDLFDGGAGIKEVNVFHNDKLIVRDTIPFSTRDGAKTTRTYWADITNDENNFTIKVINFSKVESRPAELTIYYEGKAIANSSLYLLAVGINRYQNSNYDLNYAHSDAAAFAEKITEDYGIFKKIYKTEIFDADATKENILAGFQDIIARASPEDVFVFYYAGHGTLDEGAAFYLVPTNVTTIYGDDEQLQKKAISDEQLKNNLMLVKAQKQLVVLDACHSGAAVSLMKVRAAPTDERAIRRLARSSGVTVLASSGSKQFATEFEQLKHGIFTYVLLEALQGKADRGGDGEVTVNELKLYLDERVPELTTQFGGKAQYPTGSFNGNDFPIAIVPTVDTPSVGEPEKESVSKKEGEN